MRRRGEAVALAAVMAILAAVAVFGKQDAGTGGNGMSGNHASPGAIRTSLPEIDRRIPATTETATFALG